MSHNSLHDSEGGNYDSYTPFASMGFKYKWYIYIKIITSFMLSFLCNSYMMLEARILAVVQEIGLETE